MTSDAFAVYRDSLAPLTYTLDTDGVACASTRMITADRLSHIGLFHDQFEPPIDYTLCKPQDVLLYCVVGHGRLVIGEAVFEIRPGAGVFIPANTTFRHVSEEANELLSFWSPAPQPERAVLNR